MPREQRIITSDDILPIAVYAEHRGRLRKEHVERKKRRRLAVGPYVTVIFENFDSMWLQIQEMLYIEKGGNEQLADELAAYNPMIPQGMELTTTLLFEIDDPSLRKSVLGRLGNVEEYISLQVGNDRIPAHPEGDVDRTAPSGKTSSVHFLHFPFTVAQIEAFKSGAETVLFRIDHPNYGHIAILPDTIRQELAKDFE